MAAIHHPPPSSHPVVNGERRLPRLRRHHRCVGVRIGPIVLLTKTTVLLRYAGQMQSPTTISQPNLAAAVVAVVDLPLPPPSTLPDTPHDIDSPARCSSRPPLSTTILFDCYIVVLSLFRFGQTTPTDKSSPISSASISPSTPSSKTSTSHATQSSSALLWRSRGRGWGRGLAYAIKIKVKKKTIINIKTFVVHPQNPPPQRCARWG